MGLETGKAAGSNLLSLPMMTDKWVFEVPGLLINYES